MENLVIGSQDCKISEVIGLLKTSPVLGQLDTKLFDLALALDISSTFKRRIRRNVINLGEMSPAEGLSEFLEEWRSREMGQAKLTKLITILESEGLNEFAQLLKDKYESNGGMGGGGNALLIPNEIIMKQKRHLMTNMPNLIDMTCWNADLVARMQANYILSRADVRTLEAIQNPGDKTKTFFEFIHDRLTGSPEAYDKVIEAFEQLRQTGVSSELRKVYE